MKKRIIFLMCLCFVALSAMAEQAELPCNGGSIVTAKDGTTFCKSDKGMNWWSAFTWCESQGRKLADFTTMCGDVSQSPSNTEGDCPNLQGLAESGWVWSSLAYGSYAAIFVNLSSGAVNLYGRNISYCCALCE